VASVINPLRNESLEKMEKVLSKASRGQVPIEIDGIVYYIAKSVQELIDNLYAQANSRDYKPMSFIKKK